MKNKQNTNPTELGYNFKYDWIKREKQECRNRMSNPLHTPTE
jgi:hypothetical protein